MMEDLQKILSDPRVPDREVARVLKAILGLHRIPTALLEAFKQARAVRRDVMLLDKGDLLARLQEVSDILLELLRTCQSDEGRLEPKDCAAVARAVVAVSREFAALRGYYSSPEPLVPEQLNPAFASAEEMEDAVH